MRTPHKKHNKDFEKAIDVVNDILSLIHLDGSSRRKNLKKWQQENRFAADTLKRLSSKENFETMSRERESERIKKGRLVENLVNDLLKHEKRKFTLPLLKRIAATSIAAALIILSFAIYFNHQDTTITLSEKEAQDIVTPTLILRGTKIDLKKQNIITDSLNNQLALQEDEKLIYLKDRKNRTPLINKLVIPSMYTYTVNLEDGTEITLNAGSRLTYPSFFSDESREVELEGEAYFRVKKSSNPFIVKIGDTHVMVYGTEFNIKSDCRSIKTILVSGSLGVRLKKGAEYMLTPNNMAIVEEGKCRIEEAFVNRHTAWLRGFIQCDNEPIETLIYDIENWYGIRINYNKSDFENIPISASINRELTINEVILSLELLLKKKIIFKGGGNYVIE